MIKLFTNPIALAIISVALIIASFRVGKHFGSPTTVHTTDTVYVDRPIAKRDTVRVQVNFGAVGVIVANPS